ncbi:MAG: transcriptional regulator, HxlR family [Microbacteriaceae bacterium]|jgi:DNA-binding HxlR family transcriptional regulator|nr:transcriptional regulator, HxlR family [Microbacteriaceae bacterium]
MPGTTLPKTRAARPEPRCSIARSLEVLGEKWTLLIVRDAIRGRTRFSEFKDSLQVSSDILADRLLTLVDAGIMERRSYRDDGARERFSYHLTESGQELHVVLGAINAWGDKHRQSDFGPASIYRRIGSGEPVTVAFVDAAGRSIAAEEVEAIRGPGAESAAA